MKLEWSVYIFGIWESETKKLPTKDGTSMPLRLPNNTFHQVSHNIVCFFRLSKRKNYRLSAVFKNLTL